LAKLKTTLTGKAAECGTGADSDGVIAALRAKFGITEAEAKRGLLAMKTGQADRLRDLADRIQKLVNLAYPELEPEITATLALDQFKRCVHPELSIFMISRPPGNLDEAVQYYRKGPPHSIAHVTKRLRQLLRGLLRKIRANLDKNIRKS
jgi:hypothetical protein